MGEVTRTVRKAAATSYVDADLLRTILREYLRTRLSVLGTFDVELWSPFQYAIDNTKVQSFWGCEQNSVGRLGDHGRSDEPVMK